MKVSIVQNYHAKLDKVHDFFQKKTPCTYVIYKSLIPDKDYDLLEFIWNNSQIGVLVGVVGRIVACTHPIFWVLPFIPLIIDIAYHVVKLIQDHHTARKRICFLHFFQRIVYQ